MTSLPADSLPQGERPTVKVYGFAPPKADAAKPSIKDYSDRGQGAIIAALAARADDAAALRKALAVPITGGDTAGASDRADIARTIVISIGKGPDSLPGDRLVRTIVTITPVRADGTPSFVFAGYTVAATDNKLQNIAHLEDETDLSLKGTLAPKIGGFGDNGLEASVGDTRKTSADIVQQYENLGVDISPDQLIVTRESERGLDVVGNTLIALTLAAPRMTALPEAFAVSAQKLFDGGKPLAPDKATFALSSLKMFARRDLQVDVGLRYTLRRITSGREYYTEGKQRVQLVTGEAPVARAQTLVTASDAQPPLYLVCVKASGHTPVLAQTVDNGIQAITYDELASAKAMVAWLSAAQRGTIGTDGVTLVMAKDTPLPASGLYYAMPYSRGCGLAPR